MTRRNTSEAAPLEYQTVLLYGSVTYVPHFRNGSVFVGPGYPRFTQQRFSEEELISLGATKASTPLWSRGLHGVVSDKFL